MAYCAAGKDRTGVTMAVLARLQGVRRDDIVDDYTRSAEFMGWVLSTGQLDNEKTAASRVLLPAHSAHAATISILLDHLDREHGDAPSLAAALGLTGPELDALHDRLLQPVEEDESQPIAAS